MKYLGLIAGTLILGVGLTALQMSGGEPLASTLTRLVTVNAKALAALGCFVAMFQFAPKDYQRRAWALLGLGAALLAEADMAAVLLGPAASPGAVAVTRGIIVAVANVATPLGMIMFARALEVAGLDLAGSRKSRLAFYVAAVVVALVFAGPSAARDLRAVVGGDVERLHQVASDVGDIVALALVAPLIYNVITLRGGTLLWPCVMLAASTRATTRAMPYDIRRVRREPARSSPAMPSARANMNMPSGVATFATETMAPRVTATVAGDATGASTAAATSASASSAAPVPSRAHACR